MVHLLRTDITEAIPIIERQPPARAWWSAIRRSLGNGPQVKSVRGEELQSWHRVDRSWDRTASAMTWLLNAGRYLNRLGQSCAGLLVLSSKYCGRYSPRHYLCYGGSSLRR